MWFRVGALGPVWCTARPYGLYRVHAGADTGKHVVRASDTHELAFDGCRVPAENLLGMRGRGYAEFLETLVDGRIAMGLGGLQPDLARSIDHRYAYHEPSVRRVAADLVRMFPELADVRIDAGWGGPINVSGLSLPFFGTLEPGNVHYGLGFTGNGVGPSHMGGKICAALATRADDGFTRLAVVSREPKRFPPEPIRSPGMFIANKAIMRKDDREADGAIAGLATRTVATLPRRLGFHLGPRP